MTISLTGDGILNTGGTGFIGNHLVKSLLESNNKLVAPFTRLISETGRH
jgi:thioester reductase-like protein